jgi:hypothetical protein
MENLIPPSLSFVRDVRNALEDGSSLKSGIEIFLARGLNWEFRNHVIQWWAFQFQTSAESVPPLQVKLPPHVDLLLELLESGMRGASVSSPLARLEEEIFRLTQDEIQMEIDLMPYRFMIPTLLFFFPALMCLLVGPVLSEVLEVLGRPA